MTVYRTAFLIAVTSFFLVGWTVHFWDAANVVFLFLFLLGGGVLMLDVNPNERVVSEAQGV